MAFGVAVCLEFGLEEGLVVLVEGEEECGVGGKGLGMGGC